MKDTLSQKEMKKVLIELKKQERKPVWRFTWDFPFIRKFYIWPNE